MDMEIKFLHENFTEKDPKQLMDHIERMGSGKAPFFSKTLGLVYDKLIEKAFPKPPVPSGSGLGKSVEVQVVADPAPPPKASTSISSVPPTPTQTGGTRPSSPVSSSSASSSSSTPPPASSSPLPGWASLVCNQCGETAMLEDLYDGLRCPECPSRGGKKGRPFMQCELCNVVRVTPRTSCIKNMCQARFI